MDITKEIIWERQRHLKGDYTFDYSAKTSGKLKRRSLFSAQAKGELGSHSFVFKPSGMFNKTITVSDLASGNTLGSLSLEWTNYQKSKLVLNDGTTYVFRSLDLFRGTWCWIEEGKSDELFTFRVDTPFHRSGTILQGSRKISAAHRDLLMLLGLHLQIHFNVWFIIVVLMVIFVITSH